MIDFRLLVLLLSFCEDGCLDGLLLCFFFEDRDPFLRILFENNSFSPVCRFDLFFIGVATFFAGIFSGSKFNFFALISDSEELSPIYYLFIEDSLRSCVYIFLLLSCPEPLLLEVYIICWMESS